MKKKFIYFLVGVLLTSLVLVAIQTLAAAPNPGHTQAQIEGLPVSAPSLSCTNVTCTLGASCTATCAAGYTCTGGGGSMYVTANTGYGTMMDSPSYPSGNGWYCGNNDISYTAACYARCCKII